jgi:queuosine precursor transporter
MSSFVQKLQTVKFPAFQMAGMGAVAIVSSLYVAAQMLADIASLRILTLGGFSVDGGTLVYPFTFTLRDMVHKVAGIGVARSLIITAALVNIMMAALFWVVGQLPADMQVGPQLEFVAVLSPVWRIVAASIIAEVIAELIDGEAYQAWVQRFGSRMQWTRVLASNAVSVPLDSVIFSVIAFGGVLPWPVVWSIALSNIIIKGLVTVVSMPWIYLVRGPKEGGKEENN